MRYSATHRRAQSFRCKKGTGLINLPLCGMTTFLRKGAPMIRQALVFLFVSMAFASGTMAVAQQAGRNPAVRMACRPDAQRLCPGIKPGGGRIAQCLKARRNE